MTTSSHASANDSRNGQGQRENDQITVAPTSLARSAPPSFAEFCAQATLTALPLDHPVRATLRPSGEHTVATAETLAASRSELVCSDSFNLADHPLAPSARRTLPTLPTLELGTQNPTDTREGAAELTVLGTLGEGGMGRVLLARQRSLAREVAVKVMKPVADAERAAAALLAEARVMGHLEHPGIVPVHALGRGGEGWPILVMKRIDGTAWSTLIEQPHHPAWDKIVGATADRLLSHLEILVSLCNAVHFAHSRGIVHRDLKPENVMIGEFGEVYLTDWGIALPLEAAKAARGPDAPVVGTPAYMAPEMVQTEELGVDERTDVYLLGAILHELITGTPRNPGSNLQSTLFAAAKCDAPKYGPDISTELAAIATKATARDPVDRYPSAQAFQRALAEHLRHRGAIAIANAAHQKLVALKAALTTHPDARTADQARAITRLSAECRFGLLESLRGFPANESATKCLATHDQVMLDDAIARQDAAGARRILDEIDTPTDDMREAVATLEARHRERSAELVRLEAMARDLDPGVAANERTLLIGMVLIIGAISTPIIAFGMGGAHATVMQRLVRTPLVMMTLGAITVAVMGKKARATAFNRRIVGIYFTGLVLLFLHRYLALTSGEPPRSVLLGDLLISAAIMLTAGVTTMPRVALAGLPFMAAAIWFPHTEQRELVTFGAAVTAAMLIMLWVSASARGNSS